MKAAAVGILPKISREGSGSDSEVHVNVVSNDYFRTTGIQLRAGRIFKDQDNKSAPPAIIINENFARRQFPGIDPIGKRIRYDGPGQMDATIVGVVADVKRFGLDAEVYPEVYHSVIQDTVKRDLNLMVRTLGDPLILAPVVRKEVWGIDKNMLVMYVMSMAQRLDKSVATRRFQMMLFGAFAVVALVLSVVGIYGVMSYWVQRRNHEIGLRMALGARSSDVLQMILRQGIKLISIGVVIGMVAASAMTRLISTLLFGVSATDAMTFISTGLLLTVIASLACWIPARRATKVDPMIALRCE